MIERSSAEKMLLYLDDLLDADRFPYIDVDRVQIFTLVKDGVTVTIMPETDGYLVNGEPGKPDLCYAALKSACSLYSYRCADYRADDAALEDYGLLNPRATVTVEYTEWGDGETAHTFIVYFGDNTPDGYTYAKMEGSGMVLTVAGSEARLIMHSITAP